MPESEKIELGDTVQLKSGGPVMTVNSLDGDEAWCEWFAGSKAEARNFKVLTLRKVSDGREVK